MNSTRDRIWTIPNLMSFARLLGVPVFLWLLLAEQADGWAFVLLVLAGISDWLDGAVARATGQVSRLGELLDPLADRLYIAATVIGLAIRGIIPWWLVIVLAARDLMLVCLLPYLRRRGLLALPVTLVGKAATFCLLWGFPFLLLSTMSGAPGNWASAIGWGFSAWGVGLYWWAGISYLAIARSLGSDAHGDQARVR
jgi:cardiolipin synthase